MTKKILMVSAENDALPGAKVGGVGDVLRDLPPALIRQGLDVECVIPSYGFLARLPKLEKIACISVPFGNSVQAVDVLKYNAKKDEADIYILEHPFFYPQGERVYCHDGAEKPFATDATKFAFFCACVAQCLEEKAISRPDVLHCHDWHAAFLLILLRFSAQYASLSSIKTVFSIHNLAMQGVRPKLGDESSFQRWFPNIPTNLDDLSDPVNSHCVNPMRAGIRLADKVHTVSPTYALEILQPSKTDLGIYGGEGLEDDLAQRHTSGDLHGILNGCNYPRKKAKPAPAKTTLIKMISDCLPVWASKERELLSAHWLAEKRLQDWRSNKKAQILLSSVGRVTEQKVRLLCFTLNDGRTVLDCLLHSLGNKGTFVMVGSGDQALEQNLVAISARNKNFLFLNGFSAELADALYKSGDLFLMPSSFEPCGISQMLAMREGQPCLVNRVGGLRDTIEPNRNGFAFEGSDLNAQANALIAVFNEALRVYFDAPEIWEKISRAAAATRFYWKEVATQYDDKLYTFVQ